MKRSFAIALVVALLGATSGCIVHGHGPSRRHHAVKHKKKSRGCHPSQYWDGSTCRHKGKGRGARKHDGR
jgi:hypothetical protein